MRLNGWHQILQGFIQSSQVTQRLADLALALHEPGFTRLFQCGSSSLKKPIHNMREQTLPFFPFCLETDVADSCTSAHTGRSECQLSKTTKGIHALYGAFNPHHRQHPHMQ